MSVSSLAARTSSESSGVPAPGAGGRRMLIGKAPLGANPQPLPPPAGIGSLAEASRADNDTRDRSLQEQTKVPGASAHRGRRPPSPVEAGRAQSASRKTPALVSLEPSRARERSGGG